MSNVFQKETEVFREGNTDVMSIYARIFHSSASLGFLGRNVFFYFLL